jgi:hypothetical protein
MTNYRCERVNLISEPAWQAEIAAIRKDLLAVMQRTADPFADAFANREQKERIPAVIEKLKKEYGKGGSVP